MPGISSLLLNISSQGNDQPPRVDKSCQNKSIIESGIPERAFVTSSTDAYPTPSLFSMITSLLTVPTI